MINIGRLDREIVIESRTNAKSTFGESIGTYSTFHTCFAGVVRAGGSEREEADKITAIRKVKFRIRYFEGINETMRVVYEGDNYDIHEIQEMGRDALIISASKKL